MELFKVFIGNKEFAVIGVANLATRTAKFQALIQGVPFFQDEDYELVRETLLSAVELNKPAMNAEAQ